MNKSEFYKKAARANRKNATEAENMLWQLLRNRKISDIKFRRQHPLKDYIVDFFSYELRLIIELDGPYHRESDQKEKDHLRDLHLNGLGYKVLRYSNEIVVEGREQIIFNDISERKKELNKSALLSAGEELEVRVLSTKRLKENQRELLLNAGVSFIEYDAISINHLDFETPTKIKNAIVTSQNGARAILDKVNKESLQIKNFLVVGPKTTQLLEENGQNVIKTAKNGTELALFIAKNHKNEVFSYFCGKQRRDELPTIFNTSGVVLDEVHVYETIKNTQKFDQIFEAILFFSPSGVQSFFETPHPNPLLEDSVGVRCFCIGETTADEARKHTDHVIVSNATTIESTIAKAIKTLKTMSPRAKSRG